MTPRAYVMGHPVAFLLQVLRAFRANQGFLLAGAIAYYTLLSIVPMFALVLVILSRVIDPALLMETVATYMELVAPVQSGAVIGQLTAFVDSKYVGVVGLLFMLFFSSLAFTVLENALCMIFKHRVEIHRRHFLVSAIIPYIYILMVGVGFLVVSIVAGWLHAIEANDITLMGYSISFGDAPDMAIYGLGVFGEILLLTSVYLVMPLGRLAPSHALIGGAVAALLWEITRHTLVWYFSTLSFVNVIYGSFATAIVILISLEFAAIILLLGAQVIAEYERLDKILSEN
ncbi:MAG TPA: ribonuclease R [Gammaproteobacteria bacterium]|nr:ribonuclease R [Gammaproteobacteria bacterium]